MSRIDENRRAEERLAAQLFESRRQFDSRKQVIFQQALKNAHKPHKKILSSNPKAPPLSNKHTTKQSQNPNKKVAERLLRERLFFKGKSGEKKLEGLESRNRDTKGEVEEKKSASKKSEERDDLLYRDAIQEGSLAGQQFGSHSEGNNFAQNFGSHDLAAFSLGESRPGQISPQAHKIMCYLFERIDYALIKGNLNANIELSQHLGGGNILVYIAQKNITLEFKGLSEDMCRALKSESQRLHNKIERKGLLLKEIKFDE